MATIAFVVHEERQDAVVLAREAADWLRGRGHHVLLPVDGDRSILEGVDLAVSLGGDGTMLRAVELVHRIGAPVLGVNLGHLGYLTAVEPGGVRHALERFLGGDYVLQERMTLDVEVARATGEVAGPATGPPTGEIATPATGEVAGPATGPATGEVAGPAAGGPRGRVALNEAVVEKQASGHTIRLALGIAGRPFITYAADGLIVATPTGSTAYNLSSRGPIASPHLRAMIVTPVSPHMLFDRSLVLEPGEEVRVELVDGRAATLVVDGIALADLGPGDAVVCRASPQPVRLVDFGAHDFHAILRAKFGLADRSDR